MGSKYIQYTKRGLLELGKVKKGYWIYDAKEDIFLCSCCNKRAVRNDYPYCHWCGARMSRHKSEVKNEID